jgi:octaprenyl-diphosphate synthase
VTEDADVVARFHAFGENIGIAFQLKDDLFDYGDADVGKPRAIDIKEKKMTLPLIYTLQQVDPKTKKELIRTVEKYNKDKTRVTQLISIVYKTGGIDYANRVMQTYIDKALALIDELPQSEASDSMKALVRYVMERGN